MIDITWILYIYTEILQIGLLSFFNKKWNMNESDPRSDVHYLSSSENKAWKNGFI